MIILCAKRHSGREARSTKKKRKTKSQSTQNINPLEASIEAHECCRRTENAKQNLTFMKRWPRYVVRIRTFTHSHGLCSIEVGGARLLVRHSNLIVFVLILFILIGSV